MSSNASKSRSIPSSRVILLDDENEAVLRPTPLKDENALKVASHDNGLNHKQDEIREEQDAGQDLEELLAVGDAEDSDDDDDDVEEYLEDILHTLLETEGATEQDGTAQLTSTPMNVDATTDNLSKPTTLRSLHSRRNYTIPFSLT